MRYQTKKQKRIKRLITLSVLGIFSLSVFLFFKNSQFIGLLNAFNNSSEYHGNIKNLNLATVSGEVEVMPKNTKKDLTSNFTFQDKREYVLNVYFASRNSPLAGQAHLFVDACDRYGAPRDCIATAAIARHETDLCTYYNSAQQHNCMGWGGAGAYRMTFSSFKEHIDVATDVLVNKYGPESMIDPTLMEKVFCGPQDECIGWGSRVKFFIREIDELGVQLGVGRLTDLR